MKKILIFCFLTMFLFSSCGGLSEDISLSNFNLKDSKNDAGGKGLQITLKDDSSLSYGDGNKLTFEYVNYYPRDKFPNGITIDYCIGGVLNLIENGECGSYTITRFKNENSEEDFIKGEFLVGDISINEDIREGDYDLKFEYCHNSMSYVVAGICNKNEDCQDETYDIFGDFSYNYEIRENSLNKMDIEFYLTLQEDISKLRSDCDFKSAKDDYVYIQPTFKITSDEIKCDLKEGYYESLTEKNQRIEYSCEDTFESSSISQLIPIEIQTDYNFYDVLNIPITLVSQKGKTQNSGSIR